MQYHCNTRRKNLKELTLKQPSGELQKQYTCSKLKCVFPNFKIPSEKPNFPRQKTQFPPKS